MPGLEVKGAKRHCLLDPSTPDLRGKGKQRWKGREGPYFLSWLCLCSDLISLSPGPGFEAKLKYFSELCLSRWEQKKGGQEEREGKLKSTGQRKGRAKSGC